MEKAPELRPLVDRAVSDITKFIHKKDLGKKTAELEERLYTAFGEVVQMVEKEFTLNKVLVASKKRDEAFLKTFCMVGAYMDGHGTTIKAVCRQATAEEVLTFLHQYDAMLTQELKGTDNTEDL